MLAAIAWHGGEVGGEAGSKRLPSGTAAAATLIMQGYQDQDQDQAKGEGNRAIGGRRGRQNR
jgi:hypothetical protein